MSGSKKTKKLAGLTPAIKEFLSQQNKNIFSVNDLGKLLDELKDQHEQELGSYKDSIYRTTFVNFLVDEKIVEKKVIKLPKRTMTKYILGDVSRYQVALSINPGSYLSHYTAVFLHGLTDNIPKTIYTNTEQYKKTIAQPSRLEQVNIDRAFSRPMRKTNNIAHLDEFDVVLLNGKNVGRLEVLEFPITSDGSKSKVPMTSLERTLIDITARPEYGGGVLEILNAYKEARGKVSVSRLLATLKKFEYAYPYHQAIGFLMEKAGYEESLLKRLEKLEQHHDFYLDYQIKERAYSNRWRLYYPKYLDE